MAKSFPNYPAGSRGVGLLAARLAGATLLMIGCFFLGVSTWIELVAVLTAFSLAVGLFTRAAAGLAAGLMALACTRLDGTAGALLVFNVVHVALIALMGGGAYSIDSRLHGRRVIHVRD